MHWCVLQDDATHTSRLVPFCLVLPTSLNYFASPDLALVGSNAGTSVSRPHAGSDGIRAGNCAF